jgi:hypothetical protein
VAIGFVALLWFVFSGMAIRADVKCGEYGRAAWWATTTILAAGIVCCAFLFVLFFTAMTQ